MPAFDLALRHGCDGFEFDLRRTSDARSIVCHDPRLAGIAIASSRFEEIAAACKAGPLSNVLDVERGRLPEECLILSLEDVLVRFASRAYLDIELKVPGLEDCVVAALKEAPPPHGYVVSSFLPDVVEAIRSRQPSMPTGFICDRSRELARWATLPADVIIPHHSLVSRKLVEEVHTAGRKLFVWTVNQESDMRRFGEWGVDAIISDDTERLARTFLG